MKETQNNPGVQTEEKKSNKTIQIGTFKVNKIFAIVVSVVVLGASIFCAYKFFYLNPKKEKAQTELGINVAQRSVWDPEVNKILDEVAQAGNALEYAADSTKDSLTAVFNKKSGECPEALKAVYNKALKGEGKTPGLLKIAEVDNIAKAEAGICYLKMGNYKEAIKYLEEFSPQDDKGLTPQYLAALANSYVGDKQIDKAIETFKDAAKRANNAVLSPLYLRDAGLLLESQKKNDEALKLYEEIKTKYPTSSLVMTSGTVEGGIVSEIDFDIARVSK